MNAPSLSATPSASPTLLHWTMRLAGLLLVLVSVFFLVKDLGLGLGDDVFFAGTLSLGLVNVVASWVPERDEHRA